MKAFKSVLLTTALTLSVAATSASAKDYQFSNADGSTASNLCVMAVTGTKVAMYNEIKNSGWSKRFVLDQVKCNHVGIRSFVAQFGSAAMKQYIPLETRVEITDLAQVSDTSDQLHSSK